MTDAILYLLMTDVPDLVQVSIVAPIGNSDHSSLSTIISMAQVVPNLCVRRKVFLKHQVNWNTVCSAMQDLPWHNIWSADNPDEILEEHSLLLVGVMFQPRSSVCATRIRLGMLLVHNMYIICDYYVSMQVCFWPQE